MMRVFTRKNAAASGGLLALSTSFSSASAFLRPHSCRTVSAAASRVQSQFKVPTTKTSIDSLYDTGSRKVGNQQRRQKTTVKAYKKKKGPGNKPLYRADKVVAMRASLTRSEAFDVLKRRQVAIQQPKKGESKPPMNYDEEGRLIPENLMTITGPKQKVAMDAILWLKGQPIPSLPPMVVAFHKPKFVLSAMEEKHSNKMHLGMFLPETYKKVGMHPVGRLDYDTSGLMLFTSEGKLTQRLLHPKHKVEKEYVATVSGRVDHDQLKKQLEEDGVETTEGIHFANLLHVEVMSLEESEVIKNEHLDALNKKENDGELSIIQSMELPLTNVRISVQEGKHRMVRRMLANCSHPVVELKRERHGIIELQDLAEGEFRPCDDSEIDWAKGLLKVTK